MASRQHEELRMKSEELTNLRSYIDCVLMRVIEVNPDLLMNISLKEVGARHQSDSGRGSTSPDGDERDCESTKTAATAFAPAAARGRMRSSSNISNASVASNSLTASSSQHSLGSSATAMQSTIPQRTASATSCHSRSSSNDSLTLSFQKDAGLELREGVVSARLRPSQTFG